LASNPHREALLQFVEGCPDIEGRFTNFRRLDPEGGGGAFSLVFTADDTQNSAERVVVKVFNPTVADPYRVACFQRESDVLQKLLGQKDIIRLIAPASTFTVMVGTSGGLQVPYPFKYYVVEYAEANVQDLFLAGAVDPITTLEIFRAMCRAVQRIHSRRIAHRDLKPDNFLVMEDSGIRLGDFGTACLLDGSSPRLATSYTGAPGHTYYAAPEMIAGLYEVDPELAYGADIYALGAILFEMLSGQGLGVLMLDPAFWATLAPLRAHQPGRRRQAFDHAVDQLVALHPLPPIGHYAASVPGSVAPRLDRLYMALAHLDYRRRLRKFDSIFNEISSCLIILRNEAAYRRWRAQQARRRSSPPRIAR
jgi:serine/threonine protein kinase